MIPKPIPPPYLDTRRMKKNGKYPVKICVPYKTNKYLYPVGFDMTEREFSSLLAGSNRKFETEKRSLNKRLSEAKTAMDQLEFFSKEAFEKYFEDKAGTTDLRECFENVIKTMQKGKRAGTAMIYDQAIKSFEKVKTGLQVVDITPDFLQEYENQIIGGEGKLSVTTAAMYLRALRAVINIAISDGKLDRKHYPFTTMYEKHNRYKIPAPNERKYNAGVLTRKQIEVIINHSFTAKSQMRAVHMIEFIYGCGGANITDILSLTEDNIVTFYNDNMKPVKLLEFRRQKRQRTKNKDKVIQHVYTERMQEIVSVYKKPGSKFLFPVLNGTETAEKKREKVRTFNKRINHMIRVIAKKAGLPNWESLTTYSIRHSVATYLFNEGYSINIVGDVLGHDSTKTTEAYKGRLPVIFNKVSNDLKLSRKPKTSDWAD